MNKRFEIHPPECAILIQIRKIFFMSDVSLSKIENMIYMIRDQKVMLDSDLAELYGVETKNLIRQ